MAKYEYLFFDLDGTVIDTFEGVSKCFSYALSHYGVEIASREELRPVLGPPLLDSFMNLYGFSKEDAEGAVRKYRERYVNTFVSESRLYEGIYDAIGELSSMGYKIVSATSKPEVFAKELLSHYDLTKYFHFVTGASLDKSRNDKPSVLRYIIETLKIDDMSKILMIGDRKYDLLGAHEFGIDAMGVLYGFGTKEELSSYPHVALAETPRDIARMVKKW